MPVLRDDSDRQDRLVVHTVMHQNITSFLDKDDGAPQPVILGLWRNRQIAPVRAVGGGDVVKFRRCQPAHSFPAPKFGLAFVPGLAIHR